MEEKINQAIKDALENAPERKFVESVDISFTIKDVDLKNPNNRIKEEVRLPSGRGKELKIAMFAAVKQQPRLKPQVLMLSLHKKLKSLVARKVRQRKLPILMISSYQKSHTWV